MDIRGDGGYIVGPGSLQPNGSVYAWEKSPGQFTLAEMPEWLAEALGDSSRSVEPVAEVAPPKLRTSSASKRTGQGGTQSRSNRKPPITSAVDEVLSRLLDELLGKPSVKTAGEWRYRRKGSLSVRVDSAKPRQWFDHEAGRGAGLVSVAMHGHGAPRRARWLGCHSVNLGLPLRPREPGEQRCQRRALLADEGRFYRLLLRQGALDVPASRHPPSAPHQP